MCKMLLVIALVYYYQCSFDELTLHDIYVLSTIYLLIGVLGAMA